VYILTVNDCIFLVHVYYTHVFCILFYEVLIYKQYSQIIIFHYTSRNMKIAPSLLYLFLFEEPCAVCDDVRMILRVAILVV
jgi:hypothetical protein